MAEEGFKRKLTATLSADAVEYSRLMGENEEATVRTLNTYREVFTALIQQHNGKVLDATGDNLLAEFVSVVDAVQCAVAVQKEIKARNDELPENRRMQFRIGINLGDVIQEEGRIYGDGVNIAARLEGLAEPGGICISKTAFDHIESKLPYGYDYLGDQTVKNISKPVGAYRVLMDPRVTVSGKSINIKFPIKRRRSVIVGAVVFLTIVIAVVIWQFNNSRVSTQQRSDDQKAVSISEKSSIAVMPFKNMSGDLEQEFISDGISETIISVLSRMPNLSVVARNSTFFYKDKSVKVTQIGRELGAEFVLEGSFLKSGEQVRINAHLIDAQKGHHMWSETYDRQWTDFLIILDEITLAVARSLTAEIGMTFPYDTATAESTDNVEAWLILQKAHVHFKRFTRKDNAMAILLSKRAIEIDPNYSTAYAYLALNFLYAVRYRWATSPKKSMAQAKETTLKAIELDSSNPVAYTTLGDIQLLQKNYVDAQVAFKKALDSSPSSALTHWYWARYLLFSGQPEEALPTVKASMRLNPHYTWHYPIVSGRIFYHTGRYEEALTEFEKVYELSSKGKGSEYLSNVYLAMTYSKLDRDKEAQYHIEKALEYNPLFNLEARRRASLFKNKEDTDREIDALRKAGAPEQPPPH